jgi:hypothetical protein
MTVKLVTDASGQQYNIDVADESRFGRWVVDVACRDADVRETAYFRGFRIHADSRNVLTPVKRQPSMA